MFDYSSRYALAGRILCTQVHFNTLSDRPQQKMKSQQQRQQQQHSHCLDSSNCNYLFDIFGVIFCFNDNATSDIKQRYTYAMLYRIGTCKHTHSMCMFNSHFKHMDRSKFYFSVLLVFAIVCMFFFRINKKLCVHRAFTHFSLVFDPFSRLCMFY